MGKYFLLPHTKGVILVPDLILVVALNSEFIQPVYYLLSDLTEWYNGSSASNPGSIYTQIVVSVFCTDDFLTWRVYFALFDKVEVKFGK